MKTERLTTAQALVRFLLAQRVERDGQERPFFGPCFGIFGHGNVAGLGQALQQHPQLRYIPCRNEQAMVHAAVAWAREKNRLGACCCTSSVGPGATNMVTGAALATINRLPVLLLPGDIFARRNVAPVLQQLESDASQDISVNDCFKPVSRYWDRINRPEQLLCALPEALRVLTSPAQTGAVTLSLPQDVQAEAWDWPLELFEPRTWRVPRPRPDRAALQRALALLRSARRPLIVAGGGTIYSAACQQLARFAEATGIPVALTQAGKGALPDEHPLCLGGVGVTGTRCANAIARQADLVLGIGTRYSDFTTASCTAFQHPDLRFINLNIAGFDAGKQGALCLMADAREGLEALLAGLTEPVSASYAAEIRELRSAWLQERTQLLAPSGGQPFSQAEVLGALNQLLDPEDVLINAAGSAPGDLHKLWLASRPGSYHVEYGYSCMGYEIAGGLGAALAAPQRRVCVLVGDGSYLMMAQELVTAVQEDVQLLVVLLDNHGFASIGGLSEGLGSAGFGTEFRRQDGDAHLPLDFVANAASLGAHAQRIDDLGALKEAIRQASSRSGPTVLVLETDRQARVPGCEAWWDVPVAQVSTMEAVQAARTAYETALCQERYHQLRCSDESPQER